MQVYIYISWSVKTTLYEADGKITINKPWEDYNLVYGKFMFPAIYRDERIL